MKVKSRKDYRFRRHMRIRRKIAGTEICPRMAIMISSKTMYVQFIDDDKAVTLASASTYGEKRGVNVDVAKALGVRAAEAATSKGIKRVVVDRGGFRFHGRLKAMVDAAVEAGLDIRAGEAQ